MLFLWLNWRVVCLSSLSLWINFLCHEGSLSILFAWFLLLFYFILLLLFIGYYSYWENLITTTTSCTGSVCAEWDMSVPLMLMENLHLGVLSHQATICSVLLSLLVHKLFALLLSILKPICLRLSSLLAIVKLNLQLHVIVVSWTSCTQDSAVFFWLTLAKSLLSHTSHFF